MPSALSEPPGSIYFCDNRCSEKAVRYWQFASVVGEEAHTVNLCQHCYNERTVGTARQAEVEIRGNRKQSWERKHIVGECGKLLEMSNFCGLCEYFTLKRAEARKILEDAAREGQEGTQGQLQQESLFREVLEQVRGNVDMRCSAQIIRKSHIATRDDSWEELRKGCLEKEKSPEWTLEKIREAYEKVAKERIGRLGIVQEILRKSTDFLRRIIAPADGMERSHLVVRLSTLQQFLLGGLHLAGLNRTWR